MYEHKESVEVCTHELSLLGSLIPLVTGGSSWEVAESLNVMTEWLISEFKDSIGETNIRLKGKDW